MVKDVFLTADIMRWSRLAVLGAVFALAGCIGEDVDTSKDNADSQISAIKANDSGLYGTTLARFAQHARDRLSQTQGDILLGPVDFEDANISVPSFPVPPKVSVCMDNKQTSQAMILVWLDGRDAQDAFHIPKIGFRVNDMLIAMGAETFGGHVGVYNQGDKITLLNNQDKILGTACLQVARIPKGAPIIALPLNTRVTVVEPRDSMEYRSVECGNGMIGARVQRRAVRTGPDGAVIEAQAWQDMDTGSCKNMVSISATVDEDIVGSDSIGKFAASSLQALLSQRVQYIDCLRTNLRKDSGDDHVIDSCANAGDLDVADVVEDVKLADGRDEIEISCTGTLPSSAQPFKLIKEVDTTIHWGGIATLVRARNNSQVVDGKNVNVDIWVGKNASLNGIQCNATDKLHADCMLIDVAPPLVSRSTQKWINRSDKVDTVAGSVHSGHLIINGVAEFRGDESFSWGYIWGCSKQAFMPDFTGADCLISGYMDKKYLNADYYRENRLILNGGVKGEKIDDMHLWENPNTFKPKISRVGQWELTGLACEWTKLEPTAECPALMAEDKRQGDWEPYGLNVAGGMPKAMSGPGMAVPARYTMSDHLLGIRQINTVNHIFNSVQREYDKLVAEGHFVAEVRRNYKRYLNQCILWGCWTDEFYGSVAAGPGPDTIYLKAWRSGNEQTTLINTDGIRRKYEAYAVSKDEIGVRVVPGLDGYVDPVHCAKTTTRTFTRPATVHTRWWGCAFMGMFCGWNYGSYSTSVTITEHTLREWRSDKGHSGVKALYSSTPDMGVWNKLSDIPASFSWNEY